MWRGIPMFEFDGRAMKGVDGVHWAACLFSLNRI
jgi:hypothetical protein